MRQGYVREPEDIKYLILYCLSLLPITISEADLLEIVMIDDGFGYFEFAQCFKDLIETGHISQFETNGEKQYLLTVKGREIVDLMAGHLRSTVTEKAQAACIKVVKKIRRADSIKTSRVQNPDGTYTVTMSICDKSASIASMSFMVYSEEQCLMLETNFKRNAETIFKGMLNLVLDNGKKDEREGM